MAAYCSNFGHLAFLSSPFGSLGTTYDVHLGLIRKRVVDFLLVLIKLFFARCIGSKSAISLQGRPVDPKLQVEGVAPTNHSFSQRASLNGLLYSIKIWTDFSSV